MAYFTMHNLRRFGRYASREMGKGALQAVGSIVIYVLVLWLLLSKLLPPEDKDRLSAALAMKSPQVGRFIESTTT